MYNTVLAVMFGFVIDMIFGDPQYSFHPIRLIGKLIEIVEKTIRAVFRKDNRSLLFAGGIAVGIVCVITYLVAAWVIMLSYCLHNIFGLIVESVMCYLVISAKALKTESMKVYFPLVDGDIESARTAVSMIVGRDTRELTDKQIAKATVETVAENTADGVVGPLIFLILGGPSLGFLYKTINTMDSMLGYKNEMYLYFGRCAAKLDDYVNFFPARLTAYFMILSAYVLGMDGKNAYKIYKRDRYNHASPNSAHTEAVCAGALNIMLAGDAYYFGKLYKKPFIGDDIRPIEYEDIKKANSLMLVTAFLSMVVLIIIRVMFFLFI